MHSFIVVIVSLAYRIFAGLILLWVYTYHYSNRSKNDIFKYYDDATYMLEIIKKCPGEALNLILFDIEPVSCFAYYDSMQHWNSASSVFYLNSHHFMISVSALIRTISDTYAAVWMFFILVSHIGVLLLYLAIRKYNSYVAYLVLFEPSLTLWSSGIIKEAVLMLTFGIMFYSAVRLFENINLGNVLMFIGGFIASMPVKLHIPFIFMIYTITYLLFRSKSVLAVFSALSMVSFIMIISLFFPFVFDFVVRVRNDFILLAIKEESGSLFSTHSIEDAFHLVALLPWGFINGIFRPFYFGIDNMFRLISSMENLIFWMASLGIVVFALLKRELPKETLPFIFTLIATLTIIGTLVPVEGAIIRYKSPLIPVMLSVVAMCLSNRKVK